MKLLFPRLARPEFQWQDRLLKLAVPRVSGAKLALLSAIAGALVTALPAKAASGPLDCHAISAPKRVAMVELYTSEGCSSCPPADQWLSALDSSGLGLDRVLALALHVDYWDYIGWKDRFANPGFTKRQRDHARRNRLSTIYTPQVVLDGEDFARWWEAGSFINTVDKINQQSASVLIELSGQWQPTGDAPARVGVKVAPSTSPGAPLAGAILQVALFEDGLRSDVQRGENAGTVLEHDKVVRRWLKPIALDGAGRASLSELVSLPSGARPEKMGIAAFAQSRDGQIIQAVSCQFKAAS